MEPDVPILGSLFSNGPMKQISLWKHFPYLSMIKYNLQWWSSWIFFILKKKNSFGKFSQKKPNLIDPVDGHFEFQIGMKKVNVTEDYG